MSQGNGRDAHATNRGFHVVAHDAPARPTSSTAGALNCTVRAIVAENTHGSGGVGARSGQSSRNVGGDGGYGNGISGRGWENTSPYNRGGSQHGADGGRNSLPNIGDTGGGLSAYQFTGSAGSYAWTSTALLGGGGVADGGGWPSLGVHNVADGAGMNGGRPRERGGSGGAAGASDQSERSDGSERSKTYIGGKGSSTSNDADRSSDASSTGRADAGGNVNPSKPTGKKFEWECASCKCNNFPSRRKCRQCKAPSVRRRKGIDGVEGVSVPDSDGGSSATSLPLPMRSSTPTPADPAASGTTRERGATGARGGTDASKAPEESKDRQAQDGATSDVLAKSTKVLQTAPTTTTVKNTTAIRSSSEARNIAPSPAEGTSTMLAEAGRTGWAHTKGSRIETEDGGTAGLQPPHVDPAKKAKMVRDNTIAALSSAQSTTPAPTRPAAAGGGGAAAAAERPEGSAGARAERKSHIGPTTDQTTPLEKTSSPRDFTPAPRAAATAAGAASAEADESCTPKRMEADMMTPRILPSGPEASATAEVRGAVVGSSPVPVPASTPARRSISPANNAAAVTSASAAPAEGCEVSESVALGTSKVAKAGMTAPRVLSPGPKASATVEVRCAVIGSSPRPAAARGSISTGADTYSAASASAAPAEGSEGSGSVALGAAAAAAAALVSAADVEGIVMNDRPRDSRQRSLNEIGRGGSGVREHLANDGGDEELGLVERDPGVQAGGGGRAGSAGDNVVSGHEASARGGSEELVISDGGTDETASPSGVSIGSEAPPAAAEEVADAAPHSPTPSSPPAATSDDHRRWGWRHALVIIALGSLAATLSSEGITDPACGGSVLSQEDGPLAPGSFIESSQGWRYLGRLPGFSSKSRLSATASGALYKGPDGVEVPLESIIPEIGRGGKNLLCSAERVARRVRGLGDAEYAAKVRRSRLTIGAGSFCQSHRTPVPWTIFGAADGGAARFSPSGHLEVVDRDGSVLWSAATDIEDVSEPTRVQPDEGDIVYAPGHPMAALSKAKQKSNEKTGPDHRPKKNVQKKKRSTKEKKRRARSNTTPADENSDSTSKRSWWGKARAGHKGSDEPHGSEGTGTPSGKNVLMRAIGWCVRLLRKA